MAKKAKKTKSVEARKSGAAEQVKADKKTRAARKAESKAARTASPKADKAAKPRKAEKAGKAEKVKKPKKKAGKKVSAVPKGMHTVTANLVFKDTAQAIDFYQRAFAARELSRMPSPDGKGVWHAEIQIGDSVIYLNDESPMGHTVAATPEHRATCAIQLYVKDCDAWVARAIEAGARPFMPLADMFWGDRMGGVTDPFGVAWMISTRVANLTAKQMARAGEEFARSMAAGAAPAPEAAPASTPDDGGQLQG
jgi:PhnB protein